MIRCIISLCVEIFSRPKAGGPFRQSEVRITRRNRPYYTFKQRRTRVQTRRLVKAWLAGGGVLLALALAAAFFFTMAGERPRFGKGDLLVCVNEEGTVDLFWPEAAPPAVYQLEIRCGELQYEQYSSRPSAQVSGVREGEKLHVRVRAVTEGTDLFGRPRQTVGWKTLKASADLSGELPSPEVIGAVKSGQVSLSWSGDGDLYEVFKTYELFAPETANSVPVASTTGRDLSVPLEGEAGTALRHFTVRSGWRRRGFILCGPASSPVTISREDLPSSGQLSLSYQEADSRMYVLEWHGVRCDHFEVQRRQGDGWQTAARLLPAEHMRYDAGRLRSGSYNRFRVVARNADGTEAEAEEISFYASVSPLYSTVWPIQDLTLRENPGSGERLAPIPGGTALCVLAEEGNWFRVRYREEYGWVDSRFCMINLPEYVGDHCGYDITNSYSSLFAAHNASIQKITGQVIPGFENILTADGDFLVPYLYPCAKKLLTAAQAAQADGFRLKIYEAFRPQQATRFCYDTTQAQQNDPVRTEDGRQTTLLRLMTDNGRFGLGSFLARTISAHNRGIALDLTLEENGGELEMQSVIHDLSWYAATDRNNLNAKLLAGYMRAVGMNGLSSEWWHFQDDATRSAIGLNTSLYTGVSSEGWTQDDGGWRYRGKDGSFLRNTTATVDGRPYTFDAEGYAAG